MDLLVLPGNSPITGPWAAAVRDALAPRFGRSLVHEYAHWQHGEGRGLAPELELQRLRDPLAGLSEVVLFGKSAGALLALLAVDRKLVAPVGCIFVGFPTKRAPGIDIERVLRLDTPPTLFVQQTADPGLSFAELQRWLRGLGGTNRSLAEVPGDDHVYGDVELLSRIASGWLDSLRPAPPK
jgi:pimeloyl-ACP methyl ester carboxylesterase